MPNEASNLLPAPSSDSTERIKEAEKKNWGMWFRPAGPCEGPHCTNTVEAGMVYGHQLYRCCSDECRNKIKSEHRKNYKKQVVGICEHCQGPIKATSESKRENPRFCSDDCYRAFESERIMGPTGPFRPILETYIRDSHIYADSTLPGVKTHLSAFFRFAWGEKLSRLDMILPRTVSQFMAQEKDRGIKTLHVIGQLSTFFGWQIEVNSLDIHNPVSRRFHKQGTRRNNPRPLTEDEVSTYWEVLVATGDVRLMLAFAIGLESGLRGGETCNIRIPDVDKTEQSVLVRLPTKNGVERTVPYHDKVTYCLNLWESIRSKKCAHNHLIHGDRNATWNIHVLDEQFKRAFQNLQQRGVGFTYHRLRHTWASNLFNSGMDLAVLQKLGGWLCLASMEAYIRVLPETVRREYQEAWARLKERQQEPIEETLSMDQFVEMEIANGLTIA